MSVHKNGIQGLKLAAVNVAVVGHWPSLPRALGLIPTQDCKRKQDAHSEQQHA